MLTQFENLLRSHFDNGHKLILPTVSSLASDLAVSTAYLSDMLRTVTGQNTQQHIHALMIEKAKEKLTTTNLSVSKVEYELG